MSREFGPVSTQIGTCSSLWGKVNQLPTDRSTAVADQEKHEVVQKVEALLPTLRDRAQEAEDLRQIPDESIKDLQESGFFRLLQPSQWGGHEADPVLFYDTVRTIASACGSTG